MSKLLIKNNEGIYEVTCDSYSVDTTTQAKQINCYAEGASLVAHFENVTDFYILDLVKKVGDK